MVANESRLVGAVGKGMTGGIIGKSAQQHIAHVFVKHLEESMVSGVTRVLPRDEGYRGSVATAYVGNGRC